MKRKLREGLLYLVAVAAFAAVMSTVLSRG
jgi:hypothetical protein